MKASDDYVRILIRRPHAYFFLGELFQDVGGVKTGTLAGCVLGDGSTAPLPGLYALNPNGGLVAHAPLAAGSDGASDLLELLRSR